MQTDEQSTAPNYTGSRKSPKGGDDHRRCSVAAKHGLDDIRWNMDVSVDDIEPDLAEWKRLERELADLLFAAYARNHDLSGAA